MTIILLRDVEVQGKPFAKDAKLTDEIDAGTKQSLVATGWAAVVEPEKKTQPQGKR